VILFKLLALPITGPAAGIRYCLDKVVEYAEQQLTDDEPVRQELLELHLQLEEGQIGEEEFAEREALLHARLREIREYRKEQAQGVEPSAPGEGEQRTFVIEIPEELE
jgi:hypothetical protein